MEFAARI